jgi:hypothetical protein
MSEIVEFLKARLDEDEHHARQHKGSQWSSWSHRAGSLQFRDIASDHRLFEVPLEYDEFVCRFDPARVLREVEAKRKILHEYEVELNRGPAGSRPDFIARHKGILDAYTASLRIIAAAYSDHPDYPKV